MNENQKITELGVLVLDEILFSVDGKRMVNLDGQDAKSEAYDIECAIQWMRGNHSTMGTAHQAETASAPAIDYLRTKGYSGLYVMPSEVDQINALTWMAHNACHRLLTRLNDMPPKVAASKALEAKAAMDYLGSLGGNRMVTYPMSEIMAGQSSLMLQREPVMAKAVPGKTQSAALVQEHALGMKAISWMVQNEVEVCAELIPDLSYEDAHSQMRYALMAVEWLVLNGGDKDRIESMQAEVEPVRHEFASHYPQADLSVFNVSALEALTWMVTSQSHSSLNRVGELDTKAGIAEANDVVAATSLLMQYGAPADKLGEINLAMSDIRDDLLTMQQRQDLRTADEARSASARPSTGNSP